MQHRVDAVRGSRLADRRGLRGCDAMKRCGYLLVFSFSSLGFTLDYIDGLALARWRLGQG